MEIRYSNNIADLAAQNEESQILARMARGDRSIMELVITAAYLRNDSFGMDDKEFAKQVGISAPSLCKAIKVIERGAPELVAFDKKAGMFLTPDDSVVAVITVLVRNHGDKAVSGIYSALSTDEPVDKFNLEAALATVLASARKRDIADSLVLETLVGMLGG